MLKFVNYKKIPPDKYFIDNNKPFYEVMREDDKLFNALVVHLTLSKFILHQVHDALGQHCTARAHQYLK